MQEQNDYADPHYDTVVIGGGVIGVCAAYYLATRGRQVVLIEQGEIGSGCSHANAGLVTPSYCVPVARPGVVSKAIRWMFDEESPFYIKPRMDAAFASWLMRFVTSCRTGPMRKGIAVLKELSCASLTLHSQIAALEGMNYCYERDILLALYRSAKGFRDGVEESRLLKQYDVASEVLTRTDVCAAEPSVGPAVVGGISYKNEARLDPARFVGDLAMVARGMGVSTMTGVAVKGFNFSGRNITAVLTNRGTIKMQNVVLAAGAWSPNFAKSLSLSVPVQGAKGYSVTAKSTTFSVSHAVALGEAKVVVTPMGPITRFAGTLELTGLDFSINQKRVNAIVRAVREYLVVGEGLEVVETWSGLRPLTPDTLPIIGRSKRLDNLIVATGHGMLGVSLGPITGELVSQLVCDEKPQIDLAPFSPDRF